MRRAYVLPALACAAALAVPGVAEADQRDAYIVVLRPGSMSCDSAISTVARTYSLRVRTVYRDALCGFSTLLTAAQVTAVSADPLVDFVERDTPIGPSVAA